MTDKIYVDIGVFAHNEADSIVSLLGMLLQQQVFLSPDFDVSVHVLANGCSDDTCERARHYLNGHDFGHKGAVHDFAQGGKSRTWNRFVHDVARPDADLIFMDADIQIPDPEMLQKLCLLLAGRPELSGVSSRPVKDISHDPSLATGPLDKVIAAAGGGLGDWKTSICGQLYILRGEVARGIYLPVGLPVEDGFVRAMVQTDRFQHEGAPAVALGGEDALFHIYDSERSLSALIRHQTRIVIGSAINFLIFDDLRERASTEDLPAYLAQVAMQEDYLKQLMAAALPNRRYGYVPWHFLTKRFDLWLRSENRFAPKRALVMALGLCFDAVVFVRAQYAMRRGAGAGYW